MALKFRRGDASQKSGSLQFGEPYVNTTLNTLQIGGAAGDITLATAIDSSATLTPGIISASNFISASALHITGNAEVKGNLTLGGNIAIGDNTSDVVNVVANLSSSLIPQSTNAFDLGSATKAWRDLYISTGSIKIVDPGTNTVVGTLSSNANGDFNVAGKISASVLEVSSGSTTEIRIKNSASPVGGYHIVHYDAGSLAIHNSLTNKSVLRIDSGSNSHTHLFGDLYNLSGSVYSTNLYSGGDISGSTINGLGNVELYSSSVNSRLTQLETATGSDSSRITNLESTSASLLIETANLELFSSSTLTRLSTLEVETNNLELTTASLNVSISNLNSTTASLNVAVANLNSFSSSQLDKDSTLATLTSSYDSKWSTLASTTGSINTSLTNLNNATSSYVTLTGDQTISGVKTFNDIVVNGTGSFAYIESISGTAKIIGDAFVVVNNNTPTSRYAGIAVYDSGSVNTTASFYFDGQTNDWGYEYSSSTGVDFAVALFGPEYSTKGNPTYLTDNKLPKATDKHHLVDSNITDSGTLITLGSNTVVNGTIVASGTTLVSSSAQVIGILDSLNAYTASNNTTNSGYGGRLTNLELTSASLLIETANLELFTSSINTTIKTQLNVNTVISGSSQVSHDSTTGYSANRHIDHTAVSITAGSGLTGGGDISATRTISIATGGVTNDMLAGSIANAKLTNSAITIAGTSVSLGGSVTLSTITGGSGIVSGSSQIDHNSTTNYSANRHVDHTAVSISAGSGLTGGGDISANRTISIASGGVTNDMLAGSIANSKLANSTISGISLGSNLATLTIGTGLSGTSYNGSSAVTIANTGVLSNVAGTGVSVSSATGNVTISIGQAVGTSDNVRFGSIGVGMAASGTSGRIDAANDIVAFSSSDIRFKENIKPIENPIEKIRKISGNTYDWKAENKEFHGYEGNDVGVIAQEIEAVLPQLVQTRESGFKAVKYDKLVALLIEGIKEQQLQIEKLQIEVSNLKIQKGL